MDSPNPVFACPRLNALVCKAYKEHVPYNSHRQLAGDMFFARLRLSLDGGMYFVLCHNAGRGQKTSRVDTTYGITNCFANMSSPA